MELRRASLSDTDLADERVSIIALLRRADILVPEAVFGSVKVHCPFGLIAHSDHGIDRALRVYPETNTAFCFAEDLFLTPSRLAALMWDVSRQEAAKLLLDELRPAQVLPSWQYVESRPPPSQEALAQALQTWLDRKTHGGGLPTERASGKLGACLSLLPQVSSAEDATRWLTTCKQVMEKVIERDGHPEE